MDSKSKTVDDFLSMLEAKNLLSKQKTVRVRQARATSSHPLDVILIELGFVESNTLTKQYSSYYECAVVDQTISIDQDRLLDIGTDYLRKNTVMPAIQEKLGKILVVADPFNQEVAETIEYFLDETVTIAIGAREHIEELLNNAELDILGTDTGLQEKPDKELSQFDMERLQDIAREAPVVQLVNKLVQDGVKVGATDIHLEPGEAALKTRFRLNGILEQYDSFPKTMQAGVSARIKILSGMNISERRLPQDGRMRMSVSGKEIDFRVSSVPSIHGETIVIRILERSSELLGLENLGFDADAQSTLERITGIANGMVLVTGPTGSGKTTTLYAILTALNDGKSKIFTVEDPVEYRLDGITQLQVDTSIGLDFADTLRSVLRQDPDTILIGEIRDLETARIAVQAALTGHRVLATLHTNSAIGAITRLRDMGIDSYLLSATLRGALSQRLVRKACNQCEGPEQENNSTRCSTCFGTGYAGRTVIYEIFEMDKSSAQKVSEERDEEEIYDHALNSSMRPIAKHAQMLIEQHITTKAEVSRVTDLEVGYA